MELIIVAPNIFIDVDTVWYDIAELCPISGSIMKYPQRGRLGESGNEGSVRVGWFFEYASKSGLCSYVGGKVNATSHCQMMYLQVEGLASLSAE